MIHQMEPRGLHDIPLPYQIDDNRHYVQSAGHNPPQFMPAFFRNLQMDDIILIFLIILLLSEGDKCDFLLVGILVFVFLAGFDGKFFGF